MQGLHCIADLKECEFFTPFFNPTNVNDAHYSHSLLTFILKRINECGLTALTHQLYQFPKLSHDNNMLNGVTLTVLLAESHVCLHTWPELKSVTLDVYVCNITDNHNDKAIQLMQSLIDYFKPKHCYQQTIHRGSEH